MRCCKKSSFVSKRIIGLNKLLKVIADTNRLRILCLLAKKEYCVCKIEKHLGIAQNLVSHHLSVLRKNKLVNIRKDKTWIYYSLNIKKTNEMLSILQIILK